MRRLALLSIGATATLAAALGGPAAAAPTHPAPAPAPHLTVVAHGLANPRGITLAGPVLLVSEAGKGGSGPCVASPEGGGSSCFGLSAGVTAVAFGHQHRIISGLPSIADKTTGANAVGVDNTTLTPRGLVGVVGFGGAPTSRSTFGRRGALLAHVVRFGIGNHVSPIADLGAYEQAHNPDSADPGSAKDTDPYDVRQTSCGLVAVDAGGNDVLAISPTGRVSTIAVLHATLVPAPPFLGLPPGTKIPSQSVPTSVVQGPDGALYVGELTGFPFPVGGASVERVVPGHPATAFATGFTNIVDVAFDHFGNLYVLELTKTGLLGTGDIGALIKIDHSGHRTEIAAGQLVAPGGMAIAPDGSIYVSVNSTSPTKGEVVRIHP